MSSFAQAFQDAGFVPASERLRIAAIEALKSSPGSWDGAKGALYLAVQKDAEMLWELFAPYRAQAAQMLLSRVAAEMRESERAQRDAQRAERVVPGPSASGQSTSDDQLPSARRAETQNSSGRGQRSRDDQGIDALSARARAAMDGVSAITRLSLLTTFKINGRSLGECTSREAQGWARSRKRDARFIEVLTSNLPLDLPIGKFRTDVDEVKAIYEQASREIRETSDIRDAN